MRIELDEPPRHGLADEVRELSPNNIVDVRLTRGVDSPPPRLEPNADPVELFDDYLVQKKEGDADSLKALFKELLEAEYEAEANRT